MEFFQVMISSIFSLIGAGSILFIAARAYTVGAEVAEIKELLKDLKRTAQQRSDLALSVPDAPDTELGNWPSVTDPRYNAGSEELPYALRIASDNRGQGK